MSNEIQHRSALTTALAMLNGNPPIIGCQFEIWYNLWPRVRWFAQGITVPALTTKTLPIHFSGFSVPITINTAPDSYELSMDILADEYGQYYHDWRSMVIDYSKDSKKGRPILDGIASPIPALNGVMQGIGYIVVKLVNAPQIKQQHCWRFHNFKPTQVGEMQFSQTGSDFVTFNVTGIFTHISYTFDNTSEILAGMKGAEGQATGKEQMGIGTVITYGAGIPQPPLVEDDLG